ncbi:MAG: hypothetical protein ACTHME_03360 [Candidatus Nitrosocosmicus sp.]
MDNNLENQTITDVIVIPNGNYILNKTIEIKPDGKIIVDLKKA